MWCKRLWCNIIILNVYKSSQSKGDDTNEELECVFDQFPTHHMKILLSDFYNKVWEEILSNWQLGTRVYRKFVMIMGLEW